MMQRQMSVNAFALIEGGCEKIIVDIPRRSICSDNAYTHSHSHLVWSAEIVFISPVR